MAENVKLSLEASTDERSPLRSFAGVLESYDAIEETSKNTGKPYVIAHFNFQDVEVYESTEPYNFPTAQIDIFYSERADSNWDVFKKSLVKIIDPARDIDLIVGKKQTWTMIEAKTNQPDPDGGGAWFKQAALCWTIESLDGYQSAEEVAGPGLEEALIELANGKTDADFLQEFYEATTLRDMPGYEEVTEMISNRTFLTDLAEAGKMIQDADGVWTKV